MVNSDNEKEIKKSSKKDITGASRSRESDRLCARERI